MSPIFKHSDTKWVIKNHSRSNFRGARGACCAPLDPPLRKILNSAYRRVFHILIAHDDKNLWIIHQYTVLLLRGDVVCCFGYVTFIVHFGCHLQSCTVLLRSGVAGSGVAGSPVATGLTICLRSIRDTETQTAKTRMKNIMSTMRSICQSRTWTRMDIVIIIA